MNRVLQHTQCQGYKEVEMSTNRANQQGIAYAGKNERTLAQAMVSKALQGPLLCFI